MKHLRLILCGLALLSAASLARAQDDLAARFRDPPPSARPHTWWHWMNGNVTREGITADLEAMKRIGLGGAQIFNVSESIPAGPVDYNSPRWREMVKFAASEADRLGLELCIHNCAGWSSSGGPWVEPQYAMQKVVFSEAHVRGPAAIDQKVDQPKANHDYYEDIAVLAFPTPKNDSARIADIRAKALYEYKYGLQPSPDAVPADAAIRRDSIVDVTANFKDGVLKWNAPAGDWTILRIGYTPTGAVNAPAPTPGRGLEVDKLSREAFDHYWAGGMAPLIKELGPLAGKSLRNVLIDSYEVGCQNWSPRFREDFEKRRGYDPLLYLPTLTGRVVESGDVSERFLWDLRRTVGDLYAENYYGYFAHKCRENGLLSSVEPYDGPFECSQVGQDASIVMGEFWVGAGMSSSCRLAASVAHVNGKKIVGSESFTATPDVGAWRNDPATLKAVGDRMYCEGINRFIIHRFAHQPWLHIEPGMTMGQWGTHFDRTATWWDHGGPEWIGYLSRCQYLLQEGRFAADVLYFAGDASPNGAPYETELKAHGYDYDSCGSRVLAHATVKDGRIVLEDGMSYRLLVLPDTPYMTRETLDRVASLVHAGAAVVGPKPTASPTLSNFPADDGAVRKLADSIWRSGDSSMGAPHRGGIAVSGVTPEQMLASLKIEPDATFSSTGGPPPQMVWIHRIIGDTDVYFIGNQMARSADVDCSLRISGRAPQFWHAESGLIEPAPVWHDDGERTVLSVHFDPAGSLFVVLRPGAAPDHALSVRGPGASEIHAPKIEIEKARYEAVDGSGGVDVTGKVAAMVAAGATEIAANNDSFGDPTYNHVKRLHVEYKLDGAAHAANTPENGTLALVEPGPDTPPEYTISSDSSGRLQLTAFRVGDYQVGTGAAAPQVVHVPHVPAPLEVRGPWTLAFQPGRGAPASITLDALASWTANADAGVKYFSGTATYDKDFDLPQRLFDPSSHRAIMLDLGEVREIAEVWLNGKKLPTLWKAPFALDISAAAAGGKNHLTVKVTNLWINRLIGDEQFPEDIQWARAAPSPLRAWPDWFAKKASSADATLEGRPTKERLTFTTWKHWTKDSPLAESGLIGPVVVRVGEQRDIPSGR